MIGHQQASLLTALLALKREATTHELFVALEGTHTLSSVSVALDRMSKKNLISRRKGESLPERGGKARLYFGIAAGGQAALREYEEAHRIRLDSLSKLKLSPS